MKRNPKVLDSLLSFSTQEDKCTLGQLIMSPSEQEMGVASSPVYQEVDMAGSSVQQEVDMAGSSVQQEVGVAGLPVQQEVGVAGLPVQQEVGVASTDGHSEDNPGVTFIAEMNDSSDSAIATDVAGDQPVTMETNVDTGPLPVVVDTSHSVPPPTLVEGQLEYVP